MADADRRPGSARFDSASRNSRSIDTVIRVLVVVVLALAALRLVDVNPFGAMWDRVWGTGGSGPEAAQAEIARLEELKEFHAARGTFPVVVDLAGRGEDDGVVPKLVPGLLDANSTIIRVPAQIDVITDLSATALREERRDNKRVLVAEVAPMRFSDPTYGDVEVLAEDRGVLTRIGDAVEGRNGDAEAFNDLRGAAGEEALAQAKRSNLDELGRDSVEEFLRGLGRGLGYDEVQVEFAAGPE